MLRVIAKGRFPEWYEKTIRNDGKLLSYYSKALVDGDLFKRINWDRASLNSLVLTKNELASTERRSQHTSDLRSHLKLSRAEVQKVVHGQGYTDSEAETNDLVKKIQLCFLKIGRDVMCKVPCDEGTQLHEYVKRIFGPASQKKDQISWIQNCATYGAPDDAIGGDPLSLFADSVEKITRMLK